MTKEFISPIAIDLGAENTGVFFAHYEAGSKLEEIEKQGCCFVLSEGAYTLLMANRTAARHQKRGFDRRQMAKRLFRVIWKEDFGLEWDKDVQQTISFLMNRRGFTTLTEEFDAEALRNFPKMAYEHLPEEIKGEGITESTETYNLESALAHWCEDESKLEHLLKAMEKKPREIGQKLIFSARLKELRTLCEGLSSGNAESEKAPGRGSKRKQSKLSDISKNTIKEWKKIGIKGVDSIPFSGYSANVEKYLLENKAIAAQMLPTIPPEDEGGIKRLKNSHWNFFVEKFDLEKANLDLPFEQDEEENTGAKSISPYNSPLLKGHLHHLAYAMHRCHTELVSGGRYRSKYFEEIEEVLERREPKHGYILRFCEKLAGGAYKPLDSGSLKNLIGHISNLELKPLRKYFNDPKHAARDYWDESRLRRIYANWFLREWRVEIEGGHKAPGGSQDYGELKRGWQASIQSKKSTVDFWLATDPVYTIPPYQNNNNRRPPKCQSMLLNPAFLRKHYPDWLDWLDKLSAIECVKPHIDGYQSSIRAVRSGKGNSYFDPNYDSGKPRNLLTDSCKRSLQDLSARALHLIFDRIKVTDRLYLNEIYSHTKKFRQNASSREEKLEARKKLEETCAQSELPAELLNPRNYDSGDVFPEGSFLHLVCRYYKMRQRARDSRIFIHPEYRDARKTGGGFVDTGRHNDEDCLIKLCNLKPRQKRRQLLYDLSAIFQITPDVLEERANGREELDIIGWLSAIESGRSKVPRICEDAAKLQKDHRGLLKILIDKAFHRSEFARLEKIAKSKKSKELSKAEWDFLERYNKTRAPDATDKKLIRACEKISGAMERIAEELGDKGEPMRRSIKWNRAAPVYLAAQISNIAFRDRSGFAGTCPVCSADNAFRMHSPDNAESEESGEVFARAQRLPATPARLIDGGVMRMTRILSKAIAEQKWKSISSHLNNGDRVCVPIATESNRFEFEPSKETLVKKQRVGPRKGRVPNSKDEVAFFNEKDGRIIDAGHSKCPYCGEGIANDGEIDHIIPRSSRWGVLNDEANLIYAHRRCNTDKSNRDYGLGNLGDQYKKRQFGTTDNQKIMERIIAIDGSGGDEFAFGAYRNFASLDPDNQLAFRHALFLTGPGVGEAGKKLREKVINAINNRRRAFVNGTQRYFAEVLANELHKKALGAKKDALLSFDYFTVASDASMESVPTIRKRYEEREELATQLRPYSKYTLDEDGKRKTKVDKQDSYSHLIDAQLAFLISLDQHSREGSYKIDNKIEIHDNRFGPSNGEAASNLYEAVAIPKDELKVEMLARHQTDKNFFDHRTLFDSNAGAWHFLRLIEVVADGKRCYIKGFLDLPSLKKCLKSEDWVQSLREDYALEGGMLGEVLDHDQSSKNSKKALKVIGLYKCGEGLYEFGNSKPGSTTSTIISEQNFNGKKLTVRLYSINKSKVADFLVSNFNTKSSPADWSKEDCESYSLLSSLWYFTMKKKLIDALSKPDLKFGIEDVKVCGFVVPSLLRAWQDINEQWESRHSADNRANYTDFLEEHFRGTERLRSPHQKARKDYSLPLRKGGQGFLLIHRKSWNGGAIYQCQSEKSGKEGVGLYNKLINEGKIYDSLTPFYRSQNIVMLKPIKEYKGYLDVRGKSVKRSWFEIDVPESLKQHVESIRNRYQSKGDSFYRVCFIGQATIKGIVALMFNGYQIDNMQLGREGSPKWEELNSFVLGLFTQGGNDLSIPDCKEVIRKKLDELENIEGLKPPVALGRDAYKKFLVSWTKVLEGIQSDGKTLEYMRGRGLKGKPLTD